MKHIVLFSGGHSSALVALAVVARYGIADVVLLNHDINPRYEDHDIKRFKTEVSAYLGLPITYANIGGITDPQQLPSQFDVCVTAGAIKAPNTGHAVCTNRIKTVPFTAYLAANHAPGAATCYYGFDDDEQDRINTRRTVLRSMGYDTVFPIPEWHDVLTSTNEIGIPPPATYSVFIHANCVGCLKAGLQHWYVTYATRPDVFEEAVAMEASQPYTIHRDQRKDPARPLPLTELEPVFARMKCAGVPATEHLGAGKFRKYLKRFRLPYKPEHTLFRTPCECAV